jgi:hypothetical protein
MAVAAAKRPSPRGCSVLLGEPVIYRTRLGRDVAAIITGFALDDHDPNWLGVHLQQFPPPELGHEILPICGVPQSVDGDNAKPGTWRERNS